MFQVTTYDINSPTASRAFAEFEEGFVFRYGHTALSASDTEINVPNRREYLLCFGPDFLGRLEGLKHIKDGLEEEKSTWRTSGNQGGPAGESRRVSHNLDL